ncbi:hypothetical protein E2C01_022300 [Portunus trituberculatus]|uniref:Uncharacterized protein n=1 Tax=Portunus trituberculatus TaxID=210409 RepID=A0A5B7E7B5_PORTR|nr:hypothetical protein [Portunus trituberculatus]
MYSKSLESPIFLRMTSMTTVPRRRPSNSMPTAMPAMSPASQAPDKVSTSVHLYSSTLPPFLILPYQWVL